MKNGFLGVFFLILGGVHTGFSQCGAPSLHKEGISDPEGYVTLFNGKDLSGWWINCNSDHGKKGGNWNVVDGAIESYQMSGEEGGLLMTNRKYKNYVIELDVWLKFGNDGGLFHRTTAEGKAFQSVLDYLETKTVGGIYGEGAGVSINYKPYFFESERVIIKGNTSFPQPFALKDWGKVWNPDGYNRIKARIRDVEPRKPRIEFWIRYTSDTTKWLQVTDFIPPKKGKGLGETGYIALQIHRGKLWTGGKNYYKNIRIQELDNEGNPKTIPLAPTLTTQPVSLVRSASSSATFAVVANHSNLVKYQWKKNGVDIIGANKASYTILNVKESDKGDYTVVVSNPVGDNRTTSSVARLVVNSTSIKPLGKTGFGLHDLRLIRRSTGVIILKGVITEDYKIELLKVNGKTLRIYSGHKGAVNYVIEDMGKDIFLLRILTKYKVLTKKVVSSMF